MGKAIERIAPTDNMWPKLHDEYAHQVVNPNILPCINTSGQIHQQALSIVYTKPVQ